MIKDKNLDSLKQKTKEFLEHFNTFSYSEVLEFYNKNFKEIEAELLVDLFEFVLKESLMQGVRNKFVYIFIEEIKKFKNKLYINISLDMHLRNVLLNAKYRGSDE